MRNSVIGVGLFTLALAGLALWSRPTTSDPVVLKESPPVKLAVLLVIDQLRGDYVARWQPHFGQGGFKRLIREGVWFDHCYYPYASTSTGPGHASVASGCSPITHGIISNNWYDTVAATSVYCATEARYSQVPPPPPLTDEDKKKGKKLPQGGSPGRMTAPTIADALQEATAGKGRVFALSIKDRSAILPAGKKPDVCLWFSSEYGKWVTSTYYPNNLPATFRTWNETNPAEKYFSQVWTKLPDIDHEKIVGPDDMPGEGAPKAGFDATFPHEIVGDKDRSLRSLNDAVFTTPFGNDLLMEAVERLMDSEKPGTGEVADFLSVSFSSNDLCGHVFGPDSQEVLDMTLRTDRLLERLLNLLDAKVGKGRYSLALTADHGVCPLPEVSARQGIAARRIDNDKLKKATTAFLRETYPEVTPANAEPIAFFDYDMVYFDPAWLKASQLDPNKLSDVLADWLRKQPGFEAAWSSAYMSQPALPGISDLEILQRRNWNPERSGAVHLVVAPYCLLTPYPTGTSHGTPHEYDRHVPLMVLSPTLAEPGVTRRDEVPPQSAAVILARSLGIAPPAKADAPLPRGLFR